MITRLLKAAALFALYIGTSLVCGYCALKGVVFLSLLSMAASFTWGFLLLYYLDENLRLKKKSGGGR